MLHISQKFGEIISCFTSNIDEVHPHFNGVNTNRATLLKVTESVSMEFLPKVEFDISLFLISQPNFRHSFLKSKNSVYATIKLVWDPFKTKLMGYLSSQSFAHTVYVTEDAPDSFVNFLNCFYHEVLF